MDQRLRWEVQKLPMTSVNTTSNEASRNQPNSSVHSNRSLNLYLVDQSHDARLDLFIALLLKTENKQRSVERKTRVYLRQSAGC